MNEMKLVEVKKDSVKLSKEYAYIIEKPRVQKILPLLNSLVNLDNYNIDKNESKHVIMLISLEKTTDELVDIIDEMAIPTNVELVARYSPDGDISKVVDDYISDDAANDIDAVLSIIIDRVGRIKLQEENVSIESQLDDLADDWGVVVIGIKQQSRSVNDVIPIKQI